MIDAKELRLGNLLYNYENKPVDVSGLDLKIWEKEGVNNRINPIPLTDGWMRSNKFKRQSDHIGYCEYHMGQYRVLITKESGQVSICNRNGHICDIEYVHQLQNIHPFLSHGKELELKLKS